MAGQWEGSPLDRWPPDLRHEGPACPPSGHRHLCSAAGSWDHTCSFSAGPFPMDKLCRQPPSYDFSTQGQGSPSETRVGAAESRAPAHCEQRRLRPPRTFQAQRCPSDRATPASGAVSGRRRRCALGLPLVTRSTCRCGWTTPSESAEGRPRRRAGAARGAAGHRPGEPPPRGICSHTPSRGRRAQTAAAEPRRPGRSPRVH